MTKQQLLNIYYPAAVAATAGTGLFPQTLITQLIAESGYKLSKLATSYNNFFGIKATPNFKGPVVSLSTYEYLPNKVLIQGTNKLYSSYAAAIAAGANKMSLFRVYATPKDGFKGYVTFLQTNPRYSNVFKAITPNYQFIELQNAGYATSNTYANLLASIYNDIKDYLPTVAAVGGGLFIIALAAYFILK
jgi:flagellar protein FlgJ